MYFVSCEIWSRSLAFQDSTGVTVVYSKEVRVINEHCCPGHWKSSCQDWWNEPLHTWNWSPSLFLLSDQESRLVWAVDESISSPWSSAAHDCLFSKIIFTLSPNSLPGFSLGVFRLRSKMGFQVASTGIAFWQRLAAKGLSEVFAIFFF